MKSFLKKSALCSASCLQALSVTGLAVGAIALSAPAAAQDFTRGTLVGTVVDEAGQPIAGATVTVRSNEQGFTSSTTTNASGDFTVTALPTGTYTVVVSDASGTIVEDRGATVLAGQANNYRYIAGAAAPAADGSENAIVVIGTRVRVNDFAATETGITLDVQELASSIPVGRDQTSLILLAPGTVAGDSGFGNLASIGGATVAENAYYVNGLNITDFRSFLGGSIIPFEFYRTLEVKTGGYQAEYGRALGGVTSAVTKSGSNEFKAGVVASWSPDKLRENSPNTFTGTTNDVLSRNEDDYRESWDASIYASGPIIKDRLFFYALYNPRHFKNGDTTQSNSYRIETESDSPFYGAKVDFVIADGHRLEGTYFRDAQTQTSTYYGADFATGALTGQTLGTVVRKFGGDNFIGTYTGQFTDWLTLSLAYGENHDKATQALEPNLAYAYTYLSGPPRLAYGAVTGRINDVNERKFYRADVDLYADFFGEHHFRGGFDYEDLTAFENTSYNGDGYYYRFLGAYSDRRYYRNEGEFNTKMQAFYIQDAWALMDGRLNLQLGLRNDMFRNYTKLGDKYYDSGSQWGPRIGAAFDLFGDGRTKLNAFWGRYFLPIATNTNIRLGGEELYYRQIWYSGAAPGDYSSVDANGDGIPDIAVINANGDVTNFNSNFGGTTCPVGSPDAGDTCYTIYSDGSLAPTDALVSSTLAPSYADEWLVGVSHRTGDWTFGLNYINRRLGETLEDVAIDAAVIAYCEEAGIANCGKPASQGGQGFTGFHQYVLSNPGSPITVRLDGSNCGIDPRACEVVTLDVADLGYPQAQRHYDAVEFTIDKAFNGFYGFNASYTWTNLVGNFEGGVKSDNNQTDTGLTQDFDQPGFLDGAYGDLANGRAHVFKFYGHVKPVEWLDLGMNLLVESPRKFSCIGNYYDSGNFAYSYGAASYYCQQSGVGGTPFDNTFGGTSYLVPRGSAFKSDWNQQIDLRAAFDIGSFTGLDGSFFSVDVFNVLNSKKELDFYEFGDINFAGPDPDYMKVRGYQAPRSVRFTAAIRFGGN